MSIKKRTCANCIAFNAAQRNGEPSCLNLVTFTERAEGQNEVHRLPNSLDWCESHTTELEAQEMETEL